ncbi:N-acyl homoserine lactonase family protein [Dehalobacter sp. DCM]|uniref:N-acyl homoserine lactonase family protein n=1 Tax=Dehalobacter sp. DCM TaxID=2907827 RepID=UPI0030816D03|nr:N-acyl homoserine lactonase family protein [Dehalobacter sp. DCM]
MQDTFTIHPLRVGTIQRKKGNMAYQCLGDVLLEFPLITYYLEGNGHKIIVDTGGSIPEGERWQPYSRLEEEELDYALLAIGVLPEEIDLVILTHLHWDHAGNNRLFPNARFVVQKKELDYLLAPEPKIKAGFETDLVMETKYDTVDGDCEIIPGISVLLTPGHTTGMQCVVVKTASGQYVLGGDLITLFENWEAIPHIPGGVHYDLSVVMESLNKIDKLNAKVLPGHDPKVFERKIYP